VLGRKSGLCGQLFERTPPPIIYRSVSCDGLDEDKQWMRRSEVDEDDVREILMRLDIQADLASKLVVASNNLVAAFTHKQNGRLAGKRKGNSIVRPS